MKIDENQQKAIKNLHLRVTEYATFNEVYRVRLTQYTNLMTT